MSPVVLEAMQRLLEAGVSVVPIRPDGSKAALVPWHPFQIRRATPLELEVWRQEFRLLDCGVAIVAGRASGNVEVLDFDTLDLVADWEAMIQELCPGLLRDLVVIQTPRPGRHYYYRCPVIAGNQKLAQAVGPDGRPVTLIETRGLGGYAIIHPSPAACHPRQVAYQLVQGQLTEIASIGADEREMLLNAARSFSTYAPVHRLVIKSQPPAGAVGDRPGDLFAASVSWAEVLEPHGWLCIGESRGLLRWRRPGKSKGCSATTGLGEHDLLYVFSSNAEPFESGLSYSKFAAYALLTHGGNLSHAASTLSLLGYRRSRDAATA